MLLHVFVARSGTATRAKLTANRLLNFESMKVRNFYPDYREQLRRPRPKKFRGRVNVDYSFESRYNNSWSINERIARYENSLKQAQIKRFRHFNRFINLFTKNLFDMKNETLNGLLKPNRETVTTNLVKKFGSLNFDAIEWNKVDFSTQDKFRDSFRLAVPEELAAEIDTIEAQESKASRQAKKAITEKLASLSPEQLEALLASL